MYIRTIQCLEDDSHQVEADFGNSQGFETEQEMHRIACAICGSDKVQVLPPSPRINSGTENNALAAANELRRQLSELRREIEAHSENVGDRFVPVARAIHEGSEEDRPIHGEATEDEARELQKDGINIVRLPLGPKLDS